MGAAKSMNCDPWVNPTAIYMDAVKAEHAGRRKWSRRHGRGLGHDLSAPPPHRANAFMSWMCDLPDSILEENEHVEKMRARVNFGVAPKPRPATAHSRPPSTASSTAKLENLRGDLLKALEEVDRDLRDAPDASAPPSRAGWRPQTAGSGRASRNSTLSKGGSPGIDRALSRATEALGSASRANIRPKDDQAFDAKFDAMLKSTGASVDKYKARNRARRQSRGH